MGAWGYRVKGKQKTAMMIPERLLPLALPLTPKSDEGWPFLDAAEGWSIMLGSSDSLSVWKVPQSSWNTGVFRNQKEVQYQWQRSLMTHTSMDSRLSRKSCNCCNPECHSVIGLLYIDGDCSHEIKRHLLLGRKAMTNLDSILKSRDITSTTKVRLVKAMVFPVVMYGCESWTVKKAECQRIDAYELWCWRRVLRVPWTVRRSNQSILNSSINQGNQSCIFIRGTDAETEAPILWPPDAKSWLIRKDPDAGKDWGQEEKGTTEDEMVGWHHWLDGHAFE